MQNPSAHDQPLPPHTISVLQAFARSRAPNDNQWLNDYALAIPHAHRTMIDLLLCLREEAMLVLQRPDASVRKGKDLFTIEDVSSINVTTLALIQLVQNGIADKVLLPFFQGMPASLMAIDNFYTARIQSASERQSELQRKIIDYSMKKISGADGPKQSTLNFNGVAHAKVRRDDGALDFAAYKDLARSTQATSEKENNEMVDERDRLIDQANRDRDIRRAIGVTISRVYDAMAIGEIPLRGPVPTGPAPASQ